MLFRFTKERKRKGQSMVEYALLSVLIAVTSIVLLRQLGTTVEYEYALVEASVEASVAPCNTAVC